MNEFELRLQATLRDVVEDTGVPAGLVRAAACQAARVRRRRVATRGALGAAALVTGGAVLAQPRASTPDRVVPTGVATTTADTHQKPGVRVYTSDDCPGEVMREPGMSCLTASIEVTRADGDATQYPMWVRVDSPAPAAPHPGQLVIEYADGTKATYDATEEAEGTWYYDVVIQADAQVVSFSLVGDGAVGAIRLSGD